MRKIILTALLVLVAASSAMSQPTATVLYKEQIDTETELEGIVGVVTDIITDQDSASGDLTGNYPGPTIAADVIDFDNINFSNTLAGNPAFLVDECYFASTATGGCFICEGSAADTNEQLYCFPDANGADTTEAILIESSTLNADNLGSGTVAAARVGADHLDAMTEIAVGIKRRGDDVDTHIVTTSATIPGANRCLEMDTNGSIVTATDTCANLGPGGTPTLDQVTDPAADASFAFDAGEEATFSYAGNFTTGNQFAIIQQTGNPSGGILFDVRASDADVEVARFGDGTNGVSVSQAGALSAIGTGSIVATSGDSATGFFSSGSIADAQIDDTITASNYVPLAGDVTLTNPLTFTEQSADEGNPSEGNFVIWQSDGVGSGDDGDVLIKVTAGAVTKFVTLVDFSAVP